MIDVVDETGSLKRDEVLLKKVSLGKRFANFWLDSIFIAVFVWLLVVIGVIFAPIVMSPFLSWLDEGRNVGIQLAINIFYVILVTAYYTFFETFAGGKTLAKFITGTKVVTIDGKKPGFKTILIRSLCRFVPFDPLSFLFMDGDGWHDNWSKTIVVEKEKEKY